MSIRTFKIASIPGDGIGVDITEAAVEVLQKLSQTFGTFNFEFDTLDWSSQKYKQRGYYAPPGGVEGLKKYDAIYFGAVGWPDVPDHISLWQMILPIRTTLNQYANVRPTRIIPGTSSPLSACVSNSSLLDWVIVRENSEGEYSGHGGTTPSTAHAPHTVATEVSIFTRVGIERIVRFAFETALHRPRKKLTMVTKSNAQRHGMVLWDAVFYEVAKEYDGRVEYDKMLVDAMTVRMVNRPETLDTIVATNLHADILSDLAAALSGSIGIAPSSNLDPTRQFPSMFEPIHGSAPDIAGQGIANPIGAFWSATEMVRWLAGSDGNSNIVGLVDGPGVGNMVKAADCLMKAIENVTQAGVKTRDLGGQSNTKAVTSAVCVEIEKVYAALA
ncbi:Tartrate dehydrogenase/decarboxylase [Mycena chlorophos]|uniref:Tartrate dehydrogenase/decarboxylase n=1 Tax=Mycena chlorophos TaxID=658473 RepID=A0A8H6TIF4_MYCCL|nr:Tartrate dehydrogenase/decarboxylase [Mycena chlorophos]